MQFEPTLYPDTFSWQQLDQVKNSKSVVMAQIRRNGGAVAQNYYANPRERSQLREIRPLEMMFGIFRSGIRSGGQPGGL